MPPSRYLRSFPDPDRPGFTLLYSTKKGSLVRLPDKLCAVVFGGRPPHAMRELLTRLELWVDDPVAEREAMIGIRGDVLCYFANVAIKNQGGRSLLFC